MAGVGEDGPLVVGELASDPGERPRPKQGEPVLDLTGVRPIRLGPDPERARQPHRFVAGGHAIGGREIVGQKRVPRAGVDPQGELEATEPLPGGGPATRAIRSVSAQKAASSSSMLTPSTARQSAANVAC